MRICSGGCGSAVPDDVRFCDECKPSRAADDGIRSHSPGTTDRDQYQFLYEGNRWQDGIRPKILQRDPFCKRCGMHPSVVVDHRVPAGESIRQVRESGRYPFSPYAGFYLLSNLQGLCRSCHAQKTIEDKRHQGDWPSVLEAEDRAPKKKWHF
jgi:5-methylcytosine-specific restriction endonuclease McrA